jgi:hypothetical protein
LVLVTVTVGAGVWAADLPDLCAAAKLSVASKYAACRLKADANAAKKGTLVDYSKCVATYQSKWQAAEDKYGGACPTFGDASNVESKLDRSGGSVANAVLGYKTVFLTSTYFLQASFGGLSGADAICQSLAVNAGLFGTYKAWLSDTANGPATRFTHPTVPYVRTDGQIVANDWVDLTDGILTNTISLDESGVATPPTTDFVWTNTTIAGTPRNQFADPIADSCADWTVGSNTQGGTMGRQTYTSSQWTAYPGSSPCGLNIGLEMRLYCFQQ